MTFPPRQPMPRTSSIPSHIAILLLLIWFAPRLLAEPPWLEIHSTHFTVVTDAGENKGREVALRFEQMRAVFANLLSKERLHQSIPLTILALANDEFYFQLAPLHQGQPIDSPGFLVRGDDQDFIALNLSESEPWRGVSHDFAAMLLNYNYPPAQAWFDEGIEQYFSSIRIDTRQYEIGADPGFGRPQSLAQVLNTKPWIPLAELFTAKRDAIAQDPGAVGPMFEAQSWIVIHYLVHEKKLDEAGAYLGLVMGKHLTVDEAIQQAFGVPSAQLDQSVKDYFHSQVAQLLAGKDTPPAPGTSNSGPIVRSPNLVGPDDSAITSKGVPEPDVRALYAGVQVRIPERRDAGLKSLNVLATTPTDADKKAEVKQTKRMGEDPEQLPSNAVGNPVAHRMLAWDHISRGEYDGAFAELGDAAVLNPKDMWVRYYVCAAKYRSAQAKHGEITGLANMLIDLRGVLEWNPEMANAYDLLAVSRNAGGTTTAAMQAARAAIGLSPREELYTYHLAEIYVTSKQWDAAENLLQRLKASSHPEIATLAGDLQTRAGTERKYGVAANTSGGTQTKLEAQKTPFDVLDEDAAKRDAAEKAGDGTPDKRATKFVKGRLVAVDCSKSPAAVLSVNTESGTLKLQTTDYRSLLLIGTDSFSCDWRNIAVTANYKPASGSDGDLVSLEMR